MDLMHALERFICMTIIILMITIVLLECEYCLLFTPLDCIITTCYNMTLMNSTEGSGF